MCPLVFVKQKTAYEMRISDWRSDVCSSDLTSTSVVSLLLKDEVHNDSFEEPAKEQHNGRLRMTVRSSTENGKENVQLTVKIFSGDAQHLNVRTEERRVGKACQERVGCGGRRSIKKKQT